MFVKPFIWLENWNLHTGAYNLKLAVLGCMICVIDGLMLTHGLYELEPHLKSTLQLITEQSAQNSDYLSLMVQFMSGLAECCNRQQLYSVAVCLLQQMENLCQLDWTILQTSR